MYRYIDMNAELLGIITVGITLLCIGCVIIVETNDIQIIPDTQKEIRLGPWTSSTNTNIQQYCDVIPALCR